MSQNSSEGTIVPLLIGGQFRSASSLPRIPVFNFKDQKIVHWAESAGNDDANRAAEAASIGFQSWRNSSALLRRNVILRFAALLRQYEEELVVTQCLETSATEMWARKNVSLAAGLVEEIGCCVTRLHGEIPPMEDPSSLALAVIAPIGPVLSIAPWNSSVILGARALAAPVAAGCAVVLKASELCPKTHGLLAKIFIEAGLPNGVVNVIQTDREHSAAVTETLISHESIKKIEFIGSASVGKLIGQTAAKYLKPILMELGGKGPAIVLDDADLDEAASKCITAAYLNHGQLCFSTERVIVLKSVAEKFEELLKIKAPGFASGDAVSQQILDSSLVKLKDAQKQGATFLVGGPEKESLSSLKPTIVCGVTDSMLISDEEAFGPSFSYYVVENDTEAIKLANSSRYGLNAAVYSTNIQRALDIARQLDVAQVHINNMTTYDEPTLPIGAVKGSGWGRNNAIWALKEFTEVKLITINSPRNRFV